MLGAGGITPIPHWPDPSPGKYAQSVKRVQRPVCVTAPASSPWCFGVSRKLDNPYYKSLNGGWFETSAIYRDALSPFGFFEKMYGDAESGMFSFTEI